MNGGPSKVRAIALMYAPGYRSTELRAPKRDLYPASKERTNRTDHRVRRAQQKVLDHRQTAISKGHETRRPMPG